MKKIIALLLSLTLVAATSVGAFAAPIHPNNPNLSPGAGTLVTDCGVTVVIAHEANGGQPIYAYYGGEWVFLHDEFGTFTFEATVFNRDLVVRVQGNSLLWVRVDSVDVEPVSVTTVNGVVRADGNASDPVVETETDVSVSNELTGVRFWAHIHQRQGNQNDTTLGAVGSITTTTTTIVTTTTTTRLYDRTTTVWPNGDVDVDYDFYDYDVDVYVADPVVEIVVDDEAVEWTVVYTQQNNFWNSPRLIDVGPFTVLFQPIGNTDVRVFEFVSANTAFDFEFGGSYATITPDDLCVQGLSGNAPPVTWSMHNGRTGVSRWNRQGGRN